MKTSEFETLAFDAELREGRVNEVLDMIDTIASGCTDEVGTIRLLNQYALLLRSMPISRPEPQGEE
jgi:hypothetical protein